MRLQQNKPRLNGKLFLVCVREKKKKRNRIKISIFNEVLFTVHLVFIERKNHVVLLARTTAEAVLGLALEEVYSLMRRRTRERVEAAASSTLNTQQDHIMFLWTALM